MKCARGQIAVTGLARWVLLLIASPVPRCALWERLLSHYLGYLASTLNHLPMYSNLLLNAL